MLRRLPTRSRGRQLSGIGGGDHKTAYGDFGWSDPKQAEKYIKKADRKRLAKHAVTLLARDESETKIVAARPGATVAP